MLNPMSLNPGKVSLAYRGVFVFQVLDFGTVKSDVPASALTATAVPARGRPYAKSRQTDAQTPVERRQRKRAFRPRHVNCFSGAATSPVSGRAAQAKPAGGLREQAIGRDARTTSVPGRACSAAPVDSGGASKRR